MIAQVATSRSVVSLIAALGHESAIIIGCAYRILSYLTFVLPFYSSSGTTGVAILQSLQPLCIPTLFLESPSFVCRTCARLPRCRSCNCSAPGWNPSAISSVQSNVATGTFSFFRLRFFHLCCFQPGTSCSLTSCTALGVLAQRFLSLPLCLPLRASP